MDETLSGKPASQRKRTRTSQDDPYDFDSSSQPATASGGTKRSRRTPATQDSNKGRYSTNFHYGVRILHVMITHKHIFIKCFPFNDWNCAWESRYFTIIAITFFVCLFFFLLMSIEFFSSPVPGMYTHNPKVIRVTLKWMISKAGAHSRSLFLVFCLSPGWKIVR